MLSLVTRRAWTAFAAVSILWGIPYLFIKVAVDDGVPPAFLAWSRVALGAIVLLALAARAGTLGALRGRLRPLAAYAVIEITVPFPLIAAGERHVASSLTAILIASVPLIVALLALRFDHAERASGKRLVGLLVGFAGVAALVGIDVGGRTDELLGAGAILVAAAGYAAGPMIQKQHLGGLDGRAAMGASLALATVFLAPAVALDRPHAMPSSAALVSLVVLGLFCTAAAFAFYASLVSDVGPGRATVITYVAPIVAVAAGVTVLGEPVGPGAVLGLLLILAGSWLSTDGRRPTALRRRYAAKRSAGRPEAPGRATNTAPASGSAESRSADRSCRADVM
jgi:drug/metabolite transporter (DMT)-like permease